MEQLFHITPTYAQHGNAGLIYMPMKQLCPTLFQTTTIGKNNGDKQGEGSYKGK